MSKEIGMATPEKADIINYEGALDDMTSRSIYYPHRPPWEIDGERLVGDLWTSCPLSDSEKAARLIRDVFKTKQALADYIGCHRNHLSTLLASPKMDIGDEWEQNPGGHSDRLWHAYLVHRCTTLLSNPLYLTRDRAKLLCRPEHYEALLAEVKRLGEDPSRWILPGGEPLLSLGTMLALCEKDYSCWTDQWRWPSE